MSQTRDKPTPISFHPALERPSLGTVGSVLHGASVPNRGTHIVCHAMRNNHRTRRNAGPPRETRVDPKYRSVSRGVAAPGEDLE